MRALSVSTAALLLSYTAPVRADLSERTWLVGVGGAWSVPLNPYAGSWRDGHARQDAAVSLLVQAQSTGFLLQLELMEGGFSVEQPRFAGASARAGVFVTRPATRAYLSAGLAYLGMSGKSNAECFNFGCDPRDGAGAAVVAEAGVLLLGVGEGAPAPFVQVLVPTFQVTQRLYPGDIPASVPLLLIGLRLLL